MVHDYFYSAWQVEATKFFEDAHAKIKARDQEAEASLFSAK